MSAGQTASQTVGPFFAYALVGPQYGYDYPAIASAVAAGDLAPGERIRIVGQVLDGNGQAVPDAMLEIWQPDSDGRYAQPAEPQAGNSSFGGFGRCGTGTDPENRFTFHTVKPGAVDGAQAPHVTVVVFMRGLLSHAYTRIYFPDEAEANARDPVLMSVPEERRGTLLARREASQAATVYRFDIHMQGERETVFFDV